MFLNLLYRWRDFYMKIVYVTVLFILFLYSPLMSSWRKVEFLQRAQAVLGNRRGIQTNVRDDAGNVWSCAGNGITKCTTPRGSKYKQVGDIFEAKPSRAIRARQPGNGFPLPYLPQVSSEPQLPQPEQPGPIRRIKAPRSVFFGTCISINGSGYSVAVGHGGKATISNPGTGDQYSITAEERAKLHFDFEQGNISIDEGVAQIALASAGGVRKTVILMERQCSSLSLGRVEESKDPQ